MGRLCWMVCVIGCAGAAPAAAPDHTCEEVAASEPAEPSSAEPTPQPSQQEPPPEEATPEHVAPLPPVAPLAPFPDDGRLLAVDQVGERTFVVLEHIDADERPHPEGQSWEEITITPFEREVPERFRLAGEDGSCDGVRVRHVILRSWSVPYGDEVELSTTHRFSAVEVEADCPGYFAVSAAHRGRLAWASPQMERDFEPGQSGPNDEHYMPTVVRPAVGQRGRLAGGYRFENHVSCSGSERLVVTRGRERTRFSWEGLTSARYGLLRLGRRDFFAVLTLRTWVLHSLDDDIEVPSVGLHPSQTGIDVDHVEMEVWPCLPHVEDG